MNDLLRVASREVLAQFAASRLLVALDFDGTLAPIVADPTAAAMRARTRSLLERVAAAYPCVIISGRAQADALQRVRGLGIREVIGNHGLEPSKQSQGYARQVRRWLTELQRQLAPVRGIEIEDKRFSLALHYRRSRARRAARAAILAAASALGGARVIGGKLVVNVVPEGAPHKGIALQAARQRAGCDTALFVGDDTTDEDVFALEEPGRLLTVRVGSHRSSLAQFFVKDQRAVDRLLGALVALRPPRAARAGGRA